LAVNFNKLPELLRRSPPISEAWGGCSRTFTTVRATSSSLEVSAMERRAVHVSVNKALGDGFSKCGSAHKVKCVSVTPARIFILGVGIAV
jgi:hypothetical protein